MTEGHPKLIITIDADARIHVRTAGMTGPGCLDYIPLLEELLDAETVESAYTDDYLTRQLTDTIEETAHEHLER